MLEDAAVIADLVAPAFRYAHILTDGDDNDTQVVLEGIDAEAAGDLLEAWTSTMVRWRSFTYLPAMTRSLTNGSSAPLPVFGTFARLPRLIRSGAGVGSMLLAAALVTACGSEDYVECWGNGEDGTYVVCRPEDPGCEAWEAANGLYDDADLCQDSVDAIDAQSNNSTSCEGYGACAVGKDVSEVDGLCGAQPPNCTCYRCSVDGLLQNEICSCSAS